MPKSSMAKEKRREGVDTHDAVTEQLLRWAAWADSNRRMVAVLVVAVVAVVIGGFYYVRYQETVAERAATRLQELRLGMGGGQPAEMRAQLATYLERFGDTPHAVEARLMLAELELRRDSVGRAIELLEAAPRDPGASPASYNAATSLAAAYEQAGRIEDALAEWRRIAEDARFDFQRRRARAQQARILTFEGRLAEAQAIYAGLADEVEADEASGEGAEYRLRLGEVQAMQATGRGPVPPPAPEATADGAGGAASAGEAGSGAGAAAVGDAEAEADTAGAAGAAGEDG